MILFSKSLKNMKKLIKILIILILSISINQIGNTQDCDGSFDVDLSSNEIHTIDEVLQQLGISTIEELCNTHPQFNMVVGGTLLLNSPNEEICFVGTNIKMLYKADILIENNTTLTLDNVDVFGCDGFWNGVLVKTNSTINVINDCNIEDAYEAIESLDNSMLNLRNSIFKNNRISIILRQNSSISVSGCTFTSDNTYLAKDIFPAVGILLKSLTNFTVLSPLLGEINTFENLQSGIYASNTAIRVNDCHFNTIVGNAYYDDEYRNNNAGITIYNNGNSNIGISNVINNTFENSINGVRSNSKIYALYNTLNGVDNGILVKETDVVMIFNNIIQASDIGIGVYSCNNVSGYDLFSIYTNEVDILYAELGKAIEIQRSDEMKVYDNNINIDGGFAGIYINESNEVLLEDNDIYIIGKKEKDIFGINIGSSENVDVSENTVEASDYPVCCVPNGVGIYAESSFGHFGCNEVNNFQKGIQFIDDCGDSELKGNIFFENLKDLVLGDGDPQLATVIGVQGDHNIGWGNKWTGFFNSSAYNYSPDQFTDWSQFIVNSHNNPIYAPKTIVANTNDWFKNLSNVTNGTFCSAVADPYTPKDPIGYSCEDIISKILKIDTSNVLDDCKKAIWKYHYFKKLLILKKKNLLQGDCAGFFNNNGGNVLVQISNIDSAITNILTNQSADSILFNNIISTQTELDNLYSQGDVNTPQWVETVAVYNELLSESTILEEAERELDNQKIDSVKNVITTIIVSDSCLKILLKTFNVELDYIKNDSLTPMQFNYIREVSELCPYNFGDGVYIARGLRSIYENVSYSSDKDCTTGTLEPRNINGKVMTKSLNVFPNPTIDEFKILIDLEKGEKGEISIVDIQGKVLRVFTVNTENNSFKINAEEYKSGIYLIKYNSNYGIHSVEKLVISK